MLQEGVSNSKHDSDSSPPTRMSPPPPVSLSGRVTSGKIVVPGASLNLPSVLSSQGSAKSPMSGSMTRDNFGLRWVPGPPISLRPTSKSGWRT